MVKLAMNISSLLVVSVLSILLSCTVNATPVPFTEGDVERMRLEGRSEHDIAAALSPSGTMAITPAYTLSSSTSQTHSRLSPAGMSALKKHILDFMASHHPRSKRGREERRAVEGREAEMEGKMEGLESRIRRFVEGMVAES